MEKNRLKEDIGTSNNYYELFRNLFKKVSAKEFLEKYTVKEIIDYFAENPYDLYKLIVSMFEVKENQKYIYNYLLINDEFFELFFNEQDNFYSIYANIDYETCLKILKKMAKNQYNATIIKALTEEEQEKILYEFDLELLPWILKSVSKEVFKKFFLYDKRAIDLIDEIPLENLLEIKLSDDILFSDKFFDRLKTYSLVTFRTNVDKIEKNNPNPNFEKKVENYLEYLIKKYNANTKIFSIYENVTLKKLYETVINNPDPYLLSAVDMHYINGDLNGFFIKKTKEKLKKMVIDYLFKDNWYNVSLNLKELFRYEEKEETFNLENKQFYEQILNLDNLTNEEIIELFNRNKDKNISLMFYEDMRKAKNHSYLKIKEGLFIPKEEVNHLNGEEFSMIIRGGNRYSPNLNVKRSCYSIIGDKNITVKRGYDFYYGYSDIDINYIIHNFENDSYSTDSVESTKLVNRIMQADEIIEVQGYSELQILNKKEFGNYSMPYPSYLVVFDEIEDYQIEEANRLNIPIVVIHKEVYMNNNLKETHNLKTDVLDGYKYITSEYEESHLKR